MADEQFNILVDLGHLALPPAISTDTFPHLSFAVQMVADRVEAQWKAYASGAPLPSGQTIQPRTGEYVRSIMQRADGALSIVVYSELPYAEAIEHGSPARDMKTMLNSSLKVRVSKTGRRYLIIPFRHNQPGSVMGNAMPQAVADWWTEKNRVASSVSGSYRRVSGTGASDIRTRQPLTTPGHRYQWGSRLTKRDLNSLGVGEGESKRLAGMINFRRPGQSGGGSHSQFITFRVMAEGAPGWIRKAEDGKWPARTTAAIYGPVAEDIFSKAMEEDVRLFMGGDVS